MFELHRKIEWLALFSSPLEGEVAAQRSEGGAAEGFLQKRWSHIRLRRFTPSLTLPPQGGGKNPGRHERNMSLPTSRSGVDL